MSRQNTIVAGVAAIVVIVVAGLMFGVLPQHRAAGEARDAEAELKQTNSLLTVQLASLRQQKKELPALESELASLRQQVPASPNLASVTRVIVKALQGAGGRSVATLTAITPQVPPIPFTAREQLTPDIGTPEAIAPAPPASGPTEADPATPPGFQAIPLSIGATSPDVESAFQFVERLNSGPRLLAVHHVTISSAEGAADGDAVTISVIGAAFVQPRAEEIAGE